MTSRNIQMPDHIRGALQRAWAEASHEAAELRNSLESVMRVERTLTDLLAAVSDQRFFCALDLLEKHGQALSDYESLRLTTPIIGDLRAHLEDAARKAWLEYPRMLAEECQKEGLSMDRRSRHPKYRFANGFLLVTVRKEGSTPLALLACNERKLSEFPADVQTVVERVKKEEERLFGRSYDGQTLLRTIRKQYFELLGEQVQPDGSPVALRDLASRIVKSQRGYRLDEFIVDLSRLAREGPVEIDGRRLQLRETRDDKEALLLHDAGTLAYVGSLRFLER